MIPTAIAQPAYAMAVTTTQRLELAHIYRVAELALEWEKLRDWLAGQLSSRIVAQPRSAMGCLLATYLVATTEHLWCVNQDCFWRFDLARDLAWHLPQWAITLQTRETQIDAVLTSRQALALVDAVGNQSETRITDLWGDDEGIEA